MIAVLGRVDKSKLTKIREVRVVLWPTSKYQSVLPPPLLERQPSREAVDVMVKVWEVTVGVAACTVGFSELKGVEVGLDVGVGLVVGEGEGSGEGDRVGSGVVVGMGVGVGDGDVVISL